MKTKLKRTIGPVFYLLLIVFVALYIKDLDWSKTQDINVQWSYILIASIISLAFRYWGALIWMKILSTLGAKNLKENTIELLHVYSKSWLGRYIPGTAPWILGKIYFASRLGVSKNKLAVSSLLEGILQIVVTFTSALLILSIDPRVREFLTPEYTMILVILLVGSLIILIPKIFNKIISLIYRVIKKKPFDKSHAATNQSIFYGGGMYLIGSIINGISFFFVAKAIFPDLGYENILYVLSVSNLASAISMLAIFAPSGIGVREGIQIAMLSVVMPIEIATVVAVVTRIWSVVIDLIFFGINQAASKIHNNKT